MIQFDWSKLTTIDSNPVTPDTNGYNLETGGFICNQTNQKTGYKRLHFDITVTTLNKPVIAVFHIEPEMCFPLVAPGKPLNEMILHKNDLKKINKRENAPN